MKRRLLATTAAVLISTTALLVLLCVLRGAGPGVSDPALAAPLDPDPTVTEVDPSSAPNDLDAPIVITGTDFVSTPTVVLGDTSLDDMSWVSATTLKATVPWGMDPGVYTLTVVNPSQESGSLVNAFTVTQGIGVWNGGELYGGNVNQIVTNPLTPTILYAIADDVGLFRSGDGGESWSFKVASVWVEDLAIDPISPNRVYRLGPHSGGWFYRSDDDGETWIPLTATFPITQTSGRDCWVRYRLYPISGTVYATACGTDGGESGLIASTDHGETWMPLMGGLTDTQVTTLAFHPTDPLTMYLGTANGNVFISHNGGMSWTFASKPLGNVCQIAVSLFGSHEVWVATGWQWWGDPTGVLKSANPELTAWTSIGDMGDAHIVFPLKEWGQVFSETVFIATREGSNVKTTDGGDTWEPFGPESGGSALALHPTDPDIIYASGREGVYKTTDGGVTWEVVNHGLTAIFPWSLATVPDQPDIVFARTNIVDAFKGTGGGKTWQRLPITGVSSILVDPVTTTRVYAGASGGVYISDDGGDTWPTFVPIDPPDAYTDCNHSVVLLLVIPGQPDTLLAGVSHVAGSCIPGNGSIYRSTDYGEHWGRVYPTQPQESNQFSDLACDVLTPTIVYASRYGGGTLRSTNGGLTWESTGAGIPAFDDIHSIAVEPSAPYRVFAHAHIWPAEDLYLSENHGDSWTPAPALLWGYNVEQILFAPGVAPGDSSVLYAATLQGLLRSTGGVQSWELAAGVLGHVPVYSLAVVTATDRVILYAGTTGGVVESGGAQVLSLANNDGTLVNAGVYRYTTRLAWEVYLPLVFKAYTP